MFRANLKPFLWRLIVIRRVFSQNVDLVAKIITTGLAMYGLISIFRKQYTLLIKIWILKPFKICTGWLVIVVAPWLYIMYSRERGIIWEKIRWYGLILTSIFPFAIFCSAVEISENSSFFFCCTHVDKHALIRSLTPTSLIHVFP